ncbi:hypothetical protein [Microcystis phage MJing1]|nr:hypothetical protein [Microcystis phage MJing1]
MIGLIGAVRAMASPPGRGFTPGEIAARFADRLISIADTAPMPIREQALAFKGHAQALAEQYIREALRSDRAHLAQRLRDAGQHAAALLVEEGV